MNSSEHKPINGDVQFKYIFGPKCLFESCKNSNDIFAVSFLNNGSVKISSFPDDMSLSDFLYCLPADSLISIAMRKVASPPWMVGDEPKIGDLISHEVHGLCEFIGTSLFNKKEWYIRKNGGVIRVDRVCCHRLKQ